MEWRDLLTAVSLVLVIEGILPFAVPAKWKETMRQISSVDDRFVRIVGAVSMVLGLLLLGVVRS